MLRFSDNTTPLFILVVVSATQFLSIDGKQLVITDFIKEKEWDQVLVNLKFDKTNEENGVLVSGDIQQLVELNDDYKVHMQFLSSKSASEDYNRNITAVHAGVCGVLKSFYRNYLYESLKEHSPNAPHPDTCPLPPEKYIVDKYPMRSSFSKAPDMQRFRIELSVTQSEMLLAKYVLAGEFVD